MTVPIIWFIVGAYLPAVRWLLDAPGIQSILGVLFLLGSYIFFYWCYVILTKTNVILIVRFRVWGDTENRYNSEGLATRLRDEIQKLQMEANELGDSEKTISQYADTELQFITDKVENLPPAEVRIDYHGISLDRINSYLRRRLYGREIFITGDLILDSDKNYLATRALGKGPWEGTVTDDSQKSLWDGLERLAFLTVQELYPKSVGRIANVLVKRQTELDMLIAYDESHRLALLHVELEPISTKARNNLGLTLKDLNRLDEAIVQWREAIRLDPEYSQSLNNLGVAMSTKGDTEIAMRYYRKAIVADPSNHIAHNNLGINLGKQDDAVNAIRHLTIAVEAKSDYPEGHNNLGTAYRQNGDAKNAILHYKKAIEINPDYSKPHHNLAITYNSIGESEKAKSHAAIAKWIDSIYSRTTPERKKVRKRKRARRKPRKD